MMPLRTILIFLFPILFLPACSTQKEMAPPRASTTFFNVDTVSAGEFDTGKMWTFDYPPVDYFKRAYNFTPSGEWFERARLGSLRLPNCSASFVSSTGLVFTNHHCARSALDAVNREGENLPEEGFYAATLAEERRVPRLYVDQLVLMEDVTDEVVAAFETGKTDEERIANRSARIAEIEKRYAESTGLNCDVITFYNGGKYSVYGYKRYNDVRVVFAPEEAVAFFGGDYDNFTYPRYDLDISFFRVYDDNGNPLKSDHYFRWSTVGAQEGDPVFVIGNPGRTSRLYTTAQLEFSRDNTYPFILDRLNDMVGIYSSFLDKHPEQKLQYQTSLFSFSNSQKVYVGRIEGLRDPIIMAKKRDFERRFRSGVAAKPDLQSRYASVWPDIEAIQREKAALFGQTQALTFTGIGRPATLSLANMLMDYATYSALSEEERASRMRGMTLETLKNRIAGMTVNAELDEAILRSYLQWASAKLGSSNGAFNAFRGSRPVNEAAASLLQRTILTSKEQVDRLLANPAEIARSSDPFLAFVSGVSAHAQSVRARFADAVAREQARVQILGKAVFDVYGTSIPPDATFTLRIADGVVKTYEYNGTVAPAFTTFYGLYDRYHSFQKKDPWDIPERWKTPSSAFDLSTRFNFISTNDIIGGNSGSPVLSKNLEVVGIAFDGNIESLPGDFIFDDTKNRCVSVHSAGILEALEDIYKAERLAKELRAGTIQ